MRKTLCIFISIILALNLALVDVVLAQVMKYGQLNIISEVSGVKIYVDGDLKGNNNLNLEKIAVGSHYIKVIDLQSKVLYSELVNVKEGEVSTIVVKQQPIEVKILEPTNPQLVKPIEQINPDYQQGYEGGKSDGYQQGIKDGNHQARINKAWEGWLIWIAIVLLAYASSSRG